MKAAIHGKLDCLEVLTTKGANLEATDKVSAAPPTPPLLAALTLLPLPLLPHA